MTPILGLMLAVGGVVGGAAGGAMSMSMTAARIAPAAVVDAAPDNAAVVYYRYWAVAPAEQIKELEERMPIREARVDDETIALLASEEVQNYIAGILRATRIPHADFGLEYEQGPFLLLPHLAKMRASARVLSMDAKRLFAQSRTDEATERVIGLYRLAGHLRSDNVLISSLVSIAIASTANAAVDLALVNGRMSAAAAKKILAELESQDDADPYGLIATLGAERKHMLAWLREQVRTDNPGLSLARTVSSLTQTDDLPVTVLTMKAADIAEDFERLDTFYVRVVEALRSDDPMAAATELHAAMERGEFGLTTRLIGPPAETLARSLVKSNTERAEVIHKLRAAAAQ